MTLQSDWQAISATIAKFGDLILSLQASFFWLFESAKEDNTWLNNKLGVLLRGKFIRA